MEILPSSSSSIQSLTIQTLGRITECIARLSQTVRALSLMDSLVHNPTSSFKDGDGFESATQVEELFDGINHSVKHMEMLALSVEQKFQCLEKIVDEFEPDADTEQLIGYDDKIPTFPDTKETITDAPKGLHIMPVVTTNLAKVSEDVIIPFKEQGILNELSTEKSLKAEIDNDDGIMNRIFDDMVAGTMGKVMEVYVGDQPSITMGKITSLEERLSAWINEIDDIDITIEKSLTTSKSIYPPNNFIKAQL